MTLGQQVRRWVVALALGACGAAAMGAAPSKPVAGPEHVRGVEQTLLTFPEWFLVFSPHEYAEFIAGNEPSRFPYYGHIGQFWQSYQAVFDAIKSAYELLVGWPLRWPADPHRKTVMRRRSRKTMCASSGSTPGTNTTSAQRWRAFGAMSP